MGTGTWTLFNLQWQKDAKKKKEKKKKDWLTLASDREAWRALLPVWKERWMPQPGGTDLFGRAPHLPAPGLPWPSLSRVGELPVAPPALVLVPGLLRLAACG